MDDVMFYIMDGMAWIKDDAYVSSVRWVAALLGRKTTLFGRDRQVATPGAKSAVSDCILFHVAVGEDQVGDLPHSGAGVCLWEIMNDTEFKSWYCYQVF